MTLNLRPVMAKLIVKPATLLLFTLLKIKVPKGNLYFYCSEATRSFLCLKKNI